jgi:23S rRNA pseudoU1915 N3-methylase RlmH
MKEDIMSYQQSAADKYHLEFIQLDNIHKANGHPTERGMQQIEEQIMDYLNDYTWCHKTE